MSTNRVYSYEKSKVEFDALANNPGGSINRIYIGGVAIKQSTYNNEITTNTVRLSDILPENIHIIDYQLKSTGNITKVLGLGTVEYIPLTGQTRDGQVGVKFTGIVDFSSSGADVIEEMSNYGDYDGNGFFVPKAEARYNILLKGEDVGIEYETVGKLNLATKQYPRIRKCFKPQDGDYIYDNGVFLPSIDLTEIVNNGDASTEDSMKWYGDHIIGIVIDAKKHLYLPNNPYCCMREKWTGSYGTYWTDQEYLYGLYSNGDDIFKLNRLLNININRNNFDSLGGLSGYFPCFYQKTITPGFTNYMIASTEEASKVYNIFYEKNSKKMPWRWSTKYSGDSFNNRPFGIYDFIDGYNYDNYICTPVPYPTVVKNFNNYEDINHSDEVSARAYKFNGTITTYRGTSADYKSQDNILFILLDIWD